MKYSELYNLYYANVILTENNITNDEEKYDDYYLDLQSYYNDYKINEFIKSHKFMSTDLLLNDIFATKEDISSYINTLIDYSNKFNSEIENFNSMFNSLLDEDYHKLGFTGTFPEYYNDTDRLRITYDYLFFYKADRIVISLYADCERSVGDEVRHFRMYTGKYPLSLEDEVRCFMNYQTESKYLEVVRNILDNKPKLPFWYRVENTPDIQLNRICFFGVFVVFAIAWSILSYVLFSSNSIILILGFLGSAVISRIISAIIVSRLRKL